MKGCKKVGTVAKFSVKGETVIPDQGKCLPTAPSLLSEGHLAGHLRKLRLPASVFPKDLWCYIFDSLDPIFFISKISQK